MPVHDCGLFVQAEINALLNDSKRTGIPFIGDFGGNVVVVDPSSTEEELREFVGKKITSAEAAADAFFEMRQQQVSPETARNPISPKTSFGNPSV